MPKSLWNVPHFVSVPLLEQLAKQSEPLLQEAISSAILVDDPIIDEPIVDVPTIVVDAPAEEVVAEEVPAEEVPVVSDDANTVDPAPIDQSDVPVVVDQSDATPVVSESTE